MNQIKYFLQFLIALPLLPIMYFQGKKIRKNIPSLPEANGVEGVTGSNAQEINLLTIGESTIAGVGAKEHKDAFTGALADELSQQSSYKINWKVVAKSGFTAREVAEKLIPQTAGLQPDIIVIGLGANDAFQFNSPKAWRKGIESVIKQLHQKFPEAPIVFIGMAPIHAFPAFTKTIQFVIGKAIDLLGNELELIAQQYSFVFYDNRKILIEDWLPKVKGATSINDFFSDGVHPSEGTYQVWGQEVGKFILESNCLPIR